jgi:hypothetical protein
MRSVYVIGIGIGLLGMVTGGAGEARAQGGWTDAGTNVYLTAGSDRVGIGTTAPAAKLHVTGSVMADGRVITDRLSAPDTSALHLTVGGQPALRLLPTTGSPNIIGGSQVNAVNPTVVGATIAGGGDAELGPGMIPGPNIVTDDFGTIGGGRANQAGNAAGTTSDAIAATVGGGDDNVADGAWSTVGGGDRNTTLGDKSTVGGGTLNTTIGVAATIGGGNENRADGSYNTVGGGSTNRTGGEFATVPGGLHNIATGNYSFAAGRQATAIHQGAFVWADSTPSTFTSGAANQFVVRAGGGARIVKGASTFSATSATLQVESSAAAGEGALLRNHHASNTNAVLKLIKASAGDFLICANNTGSSETPRCHIDGNGTFTGGSDFAEALPAKGGRAGYEPGDVLVLSGDREGGVEKATRAHDARVAGVFSTRPAVLGADKDGVTRVDPDDVPVAIVGIVPTKVSAENGPIRPGDLLTTATVPGHAMKATPVVVSGVALHATGTILGKAIGSLETGTGVIKVLITLK